MASTISTLIYKIVTRVVNVNKNIKTLVACWLWKRFNIKLILFKIRKSLFLYYVLS